MTMKLHSKRVTALAAVLLSSAMILSACGGDDGGDGGGSSDATTVTFLPKNLGNPYFDTSDKGGKTAVEEFDGKFEEVGPQEASPDAPGGVHQHRGAAAGQGAGGLRQRPEGDL